MEILGIDIESLFIGIIVGAIILLFVLHTFQPNPIMVDCGCGAQSAMCGQCIKGGNLSAAICGAFK